MLSWIFRHRSRLGLIYGIAPALPALPAPSPKAQVQGCPPGTALRPGDWARRQHYVVLRPMQPNGG